MYWAIGSIVIYQKHWPLDFFAGNPPAQIPFTNVLYEKSHSVMGEIGNQ